MDYFRRFTFLFAAPSFDADDLEGVRYNQIVSEIERSGFEVIRARRLEDAEIAVKTAARSAASSWSISARRCFATISTIRCSTSAIS
jgi:hypothetical protein